MKKKILIGFIKDDKSEEIVNSLYEYFINKNRFEIKTLNLGDFTNGFGKISLNVYNKVRNNSRAFAFFHGIINNKVGSKSASKAGLKAFDINKIKNEILRFNPDFVISVNPNVSLIVNLCKKEMLINSKLLTLITELSPNKWWITNNNSDYFVVDNNIIKASIIKMGVNEKKVYSLGIPKNNLKCTLEDKNTVLRKYSLNDKVPTVMFFAGGTSGHDYTFDYFKTLVKNKLPINIIFMAGKNKALKSKCEDYCFKNKIRNTLVLGYLKSIDNLMNISDIIITKPGSKTLIECLSLKKPSILIPGIDGEEVYNAKFMTKNHYSSKVKSPAMLVRKVKMYLKYPFIVSSMKNKLNKVNENDSLKSIYEFVNNEISSH